MAFMKSAVNGMLIYIPDRMVAMRLPMAYTSEQNGHLVVKDSISGEPLVSFDTKSPEEFVGVKASDAIKLAGRMADESRIESEQKQTSSLGKAIPVKDGENPFKTPKSATSVAQPSK